tara:strand:- start:219 stop:440 length:222 start_codon:yes stop_codon:yes gene_type:complete
MKDKVTQLNGMLMDALISDLQDPDRRGPGLYTVVRGVVNDNRESVDSIPKETLDEVAEAMSDAVPFKFKEATY